MLKIILSPVRPTIILGRNPIIRDTKLILRRPLITIIIRVIAIATITRHIITMRDHHIRRQKHIGIRMLRSALIRTMLARRRAATARLELEHPQANGPPERAAPRLG